MLNTFMKYKAGKAAHRQSREIKPADIERAGKILFAVFTRYGDAIMSFKIISEFIGKHPDKQYFIVTSNQLRPYADRLLARRSTKIISLNKRINQIRGYTALSSLAREEIDLGFNPFSHGADSESFLGITKKFLFYRDFSSHPIEYNLYRRVREYLLLDTVKANSKRPELNNIKTIVIVPSSTNRLKSLDASDLTSLLKQVRASFPCSIITVATEKGTPEIKPPDVKSFVFAKSQRNSREFLSLLDSSELFIGVDSGPMHLALALGKKTIAIFGPTSPQTVLDTTHETLAIRTDKLKGVFCDITDCATPLCIHDLFKTDFLKDKTNIDFSLKIRREAKKCKAL